METSKLLLLFGDNETGFTGGNLNPNGISTDHNFKENISTVSSGATTDNDSFWTCVRTGAEHTVNTDITTNLIPTNELGRSTAGQGIFALFTNDLLWSEDITNVAWTGAATVTANQGIAPDGNLTADLVSNLQGGAGFRKGQALVVNSSSVGNSSVFIKGIGSDIGKTIGWTIESTNGTAVSTTELVTLTAEWQRIDADITFLGDNTSARVYLDNNGSSDADSCLLWGASKTETSFVTPYAATTTTAETVGDETVSVASSELGFGASERMVIIDFDSALHAPSSAIYIFSAGAGVSDRWYAFRFGSSIFFRQDKTASSQASVTIATGLSGTEPLKIAFGSDGGLLKAVVNGGAVQTVATSDGNDLPALTPFYIGSNVTGGSLLANSLYRKVTSYPIWDDTIAQDSTA